MWVIEGPFDGEVSGDISFQKRKLLKPNTTYPLGRKDKALIVNSKKISHEHCDIIVGSHTVDDARDPSKRPTLEIYHRGKNGRGMTIARKGLEDALVAPPQMKTTLEHGDPISLVTGIIATVYWVPICAYAPPNIKPPISIDACAALGIKLVNRPQENITHHLASHYTANLPIATSLLTLARMVKPEWLLEILRLGALPRAAEQSQSTEPGTSLEDLFILPLETKYRPSFSPSLLPSQKKFDIWEPNEERVNFFASLRFICVHEKVTQVEGELREAIHRGGGTLEMFDVHGGVAKFRKALTRSLAKEGKRTVVVADVDAMQTAVGRVEWAEIVAEARSSGLNIFSPAKVVQSVLEVKLELLESNGTPVEEAPYSPLPDVIPNSIPEEQTIPRPPQPQAAPASEPEPIAGPSNGPPAPPKRKLIRRATSRETSQGPAATTLATTTMAMTGSQALPAEGAQPVVKPKRVLTRRVFDDKPAVTGSGDNAGGRMSPPPAPTKTGPTPARKLKRRVGVPGATGTFTSQTDSMMTGLGETYGGEAEENRPLKKFKALFDASDPEAALASSTGEGAPAQGAAAAKSYEMVDSLAPFASAMSQTQTDLGTQPAGAAGGRHPLRSMGASSLAVLREEEEETQSTVPPLNALAARGSKRRLDAVDEDAEMDVDGNADNGGAENGAPAAKRRALEDTGAVNRLNTQAQVPSSTQKTRNPGAAPNAPDKDAAFLKALASTKKGKKAEDEFDREFNKLRISKPKTVDEELEARREREEEEWALLKEFDKDGEGAEGLRGNFMVVVEMDLFRKDGEGGRRVVGAKNPRWEGEPNFKKFKKKIVGTPRAKVDLFISDANDYGMGSAYWKGGSSQAQTQKAYKDSQMDWQSQSQSEDQSQQPVVAADSDFDMSSQPAKSRKPPSKAESAAAGKSQRSTAKSKASGKGRSQSKAADNPLFLDSDDEEENNFRGFGDEDSQRRSQVRRGASEVLDQVFEADEDQTLHSSAEAAKAKASSSKPPSKSVTKTPAAAVPAATTGKSTRSGAGTGTSKTAVATKAKKAAPVIVDDDSDDGAVFRGFQGR